MKPLPSGEQAPTTWEGAIKVLTEALEHRDIEYIKHHGAMSSHFSFGMWLRNEWGLWHGSPLAKWFNRCGIGHADDMSGCLLQYLDEYVHGRGQEFDLNAAVQHYREYWLKKGIDPLTQEKTRETMATET